MKYFIDCEFLEGQQKRWFGKTKPTIDLISIALVDETGREFYAISKDFNLKEAWNKFQQRTGEGDRNNIQPREYWIRENVLLPIYKELVYKYSSYYDHAHRMGVGVIVKDVFDFNYKNLKWLLRRYGQSNINIANDICAFIYGDDCGVSGMSAIEMAMKYEINDKSKKPEFYGYYADYDWVVFCWIFGNMMNLPKGFPMYCRDLKQMMDDKNLTKEWKKENCPDPIGEHDALVDAKWNLKLFNTINKK